MEDVQVSELTFIQALARKCESCMSCRLWADRTQTVFGDGDEEADFMIVGEAPSQAEDEQGIPFVGRSGQLLNKWISLLDLERSNVYITNIIKCRPPGNRDPLEDEVESCRNFLNMQIQLVKPKAIMVVGNVALKALTKDSEGITKRRGQWIDYEGIPLMPTYHPAYLLRNGSQDNINAVKADLQQVKDKINEEENGS